MAAKAKMKEISMEEALWKSADKLRGSVEPSEYKHVVASKQFIGDCRKECQIFVEINSYICYIYPYITKSRQTFKFAGGY